MSREISRQLRRSHGRPQRQVASGSRPQAGGSQPGSRASHAFQNPAHHVQGERSYHGTDRLEAWYVAVRDAEAGAEIASQIVQEAVTPSIDKYAVGSKRRVSPSSRDFELLIASKKHEYRGLMCSQKSK